MKVLTVDDDEMMRELLVATLMSIGHKDVVSAASAKEALALCEEAREPFECILLDIQMPEMTGIELCGVLRGNLTYGETPIIMLTAMTDRKFVEAAFAAGATDYLNKPFDMLELSSRIRAAAAANAQSRIIETACQQIVEMKEQIEELSSAPFDDRISFTDVPSMVDQAALENIVLQLSKGELSKSAAAAFKLDQFPYMHENLSAPDVAANLVSVARAVVSAFHGERMRLAYFGSGLFVCVADRGFHGTARALHQQVQDKLNAMRIEVGPGYSGRATISMGMASGAGRVPLFGKSHSPATVIERAIGNLETGTSAAGSPLAEPVSLDRRFLH